MPHRATPSPNLLARVRAFFGLRRADLALYLGVSEALIQHIEAGRRRLTTEVLQALLPLLAHLPTAAVAPAANTPFALPPDTPAPDAAELDFRRRVCLQQAARLSQQLAQLEQQACVAQRWAEGLPALLQAAEAADAADLAATERATWLAGWLRRRARPLPVADATRWHLLRARITALTAEAAVLAGAGPLSQA